MVYLLYRHKDPTAALEAGYHQVQYDGVRVISVNVAIQTSSTDILGPCNQVILGNDQQTPAQEPHLLK